MCKGYLLNKLYTDSLNYWKRFESSQEKLFILIKDLKILLDFRAEIQTSFCILYEWFPKDEINLFSTLRNLIVLGNIKKARHLAYNLNKQEAMIKLSTSKKFFTKKGHNAWLQTIPLLSKCTNPSLDNFLKILDQSRVNNRFQDKNFSNSGEFIFLVNQLTLSTEHREYLFNIIDTQEELDLLIKADLRDSVVDVLFPFPYEYNSTEKINDLLTASPIPLNCQHLAHRLTFDQLKFLFLIFFQDVSNGFIVFGNYRKLLLALIESVDTFESLATKYQWLQPFFNSVDFEYWLHSWSIKTLMMPLRTFESNFPDISDYFVKTGNIHHPGKILCLWARDKRMWPLICEQLDLDCWSGELRVGLIYQMIIVSDSLDHYENLSKLILSDLPPNFNAKSKKPYKCVKRDLIPLIKNLSTFQSLETTKANLKFYVKNFHNIKKFGSKAVIKSIKDLHKINFIEIWAMNKQAI
jgi:hypothetical protein